MKKKDLTKEAWIIVVGMLLHLWIAKILRLIGDSCGGFLVVDRETTLRTKTMWARILVKLEGKKRPSIINILEGTRSFELQVWSELLPWMAEVLSSKRG